MGLSEKDGAALLARAAQLAPLTQREVDRLDRIRELVEALPDATREDFTPEEDLTLEAGEQRALAKVLDAAGLDWVHVPNEGKRASGALLVAAGLKRGFPDVCVFTPAADGRGTVLELKRPGLRPRRALPAGAPPWAPGCFTADQRRWLERFEALGWHALVAYGADDAVRQLAALGYALGEVG